MALLQIGGKDMPTPTEYSISYMDLSKADRNANGSMIIERIATKRKLALTWSYITAVDLSTILQAIAPTSYTVYFRDAQYNNMQTGVFYCGDRNVGMISYIDGNPVYKDFSFDLIEL